MESGVGIIGLGLLGSAIAERLIGGGVSVSGYDLDSLRRQEFVEAGGLPMSSSGEVLAAASTILLSLPTSDIAEQVLNAHLAILPGKTIIDTTTGDAEQMAGFGRKLADIGAIYIDATVAGSSTQVRAGKAVVMLGGEAHACQQIQPLLSHFAHQVFHLGPCGSGARMKLVVNLVLGLNRAVLAEGLAFAARTGVDPRQALEVLKAGPAFSRVMETKGEKMLSSNFAPEARLSQHLKDVVLILAAGEAAGAYLPLSQLHASLLRMVESTGDGELDNSAIIRAFLGTTGTL